MAWTHVWCDKKWMRRRTITPIAFRDRCDPSDACKIKFEVMTSSPKFLEAGWAHSSHFLNLSFWAQLHQIGWNLVSTRKNHLKLAFARIKNEWYIARPSKILCCIAMIVRMSAKANYTIGKPLENYFASTQRSLCFSLTSSFWSIFNGKCPFGVWKPKNHLELTFGVIKNEWDLVRSPRLLSEIDVILVMLAKSNLRLWKAPKMLLKPFELTQTTFWISHFEPNWIKFHSKWEI